MKMLVVGAGVIGTVYGAHIAAAGSKVSVLSHGPRTSDFRAVTLGVEERGLVRRPGGWLDVATGAGPPGDGRRHDRYRSAVRVYPVSTSPSGM